MLNWLLAFLLALILFPKTFATSQIVTTTIQASEVQVLLWAEVIAREQNTPFHSCSHQQQLYSTIASVQSSAISSLFLERRVETAIINNNNRRVKPQAKSKQTRVTRQQQYISDIISSLQHHIMQSSAAAIAAAKMQSDTRESRMTRELSRSNRYSGSAASSTGSNHGTVSPDNTLCTWDTEFDPIRDDAINSTGIFPSGFDPTVPEIHRGILGKLKIPGFQTRYRRWGGASGPLPEPYPYGISDSAVANAFADFSSGPMEVETVSESLEAGRGLLDRRPASASINNTNQTDNITNTADRDTFSGNQSHAHAFNILKQVKDQNVFHTPKKTQPLQVKSSTILQDALRNNAAQKESNPHIHNITVEQKENIPPRQKSISTRSPYVSNASRSITGERRSPAELQARVTDGSQDGSMVIDERPSNVTYQPRNSRFFKAEPRAPQPAPQLKPQPAQIFSRKEAARAAENAQRLRSNPQDTPTRVPSKAHTSSHAANHTVASNTGNPTQKSFIIQAPIESSEHGTAASTVINQGVPVQIRGGRLQDRRFSRRSKRQVSGVDDMDVDQEEEDLYAMLDESRDKNAELEMLLSTAQSTILKLENEKNQLALDNEHLQARQRSDSALGESDGEGSRKQKLAETEMKRLASEAVSLQTLLDQSQQTVSNHELLLKAKNADCEQALKQVSQCHGLIRSLRQENESLRSENIALKDEIENLNSQLGHIAAERESLDNENMSLRAENNDLNSHVTRLAAQRETLETLNAELGNECDNLQGQLAKTIDERDELTHTSKSKETSLEKQVDQLIVERHKTILNNQKLETNLKDQIHQLLIQNDENTHIWESKEIALLAKVRRQGDVIRVLQDRSNQILEKTQNLDIKLSKSSGDNIKLPKSSSNNIKASKSSGGNIKLSKSSSDNIKACKPSGDNIELSKSFDDNTVEIHPIHTNVTEDTFNGSNFSSELGHGYMENLRRTGRALKTLEAQYDEVAAGDENTQDMTTQTIQSGRNSRAASIRPISQQSIRNNTIQSVQSANSSHVPSAKGLPSILKNGEPQIQEDFTDRFSVKSHNSNIEQTSGSNLHRRHSQSNESHIIKTNTLHRRYNSDLSIQTNNRHGNGCEDITSALLVEDIMAAQHSNETKDHPVLSPDARRVLDGLCKHNCKNCTICARLTGFEVKVKIHKPVPVSERMPDYEDEPTMRPSVSPGEALATVIKCLEDEVTHLKMKHSEVQEIYMKHDVSLGKRQRKALKENLSNLLIEIERKSEQVYALYDVLEGQKQSGQEMTKDDLDITLTKFGVDVNMEQEAPWEGIVDDE